jgi:hypothetical protein
MDTKRHHDEELTKIENLENVFSLKGWAVQKGGCMQMVTVTLKIKYL